jgi:hypothetical protein
MPTENIQHLSVHQLITPSWNAAWWVPSCRETERKILPILKNNIYLTIVSASGCASSDVSVRSESESFSRPRSLHACAAIVIGRKRYFSGAVCFHNEQ